MIKIILGFSGSDTDDEQEHRIAAPQHRRINK